MQAHASVHKQSEKSERARKQQHRGEHTARDCSVCRTTPKRPLGIAASNGHVEAVRALLAAGADKTVHKVGNSAGAGEEQRQAGTQIPTLHSARRRASSPAR